MLGVLLAALLQAAPLQLVDVKAESVGPQQKVLLEASAEWGPVAVKRDGGEVVATLESVSTPNALAPPTLSPPLQALRFVRTGATLEVRITVAPEVPFEVQRKGRQLALVFGEAPPEPVAPEMIDPKLLSLYRSLQPAEGQTLSPLSPPSDTATTLDEEAPPGIGIGPLRFQPSILVGYANTRTTIETPQPVDDSFFQIEPRLGSQLTLLEGRFRANYEPQIRVRSGFAKVNRPSHEANAMLELPFAGRFVLRAGDHFATATIDAREVDPGREYFFRLGRFTRNEIRLGLTFEIGPRLKLVGTGSNNDVRFKESTSFFSYKQRRADAGFEFMLSEGARARLVYAYEDTPAPRERPIVESNAQSAHVGLDGEILPLINGNISVGYRWHRAPRAGSGGQSYEGAVATAQLTKEFTSRTRIVITGGRHVLLSSYENNAFYISNSADAALELQLPLGLSGRVGGGYHWNAYRAVSSAFRGPREDRLYGWTAGLSRPLREWCYLRLDYARDRRDSNVPGLDSESSMLLVQMGIGLFGAAAR